MTRIGLAKKGTVTEEAKAVAAKEGLPPERLSEDIANGLSVIPKNVLRDIRPLGIGRGLATKVNANIGTSRDRESLDEELEKLRLLERYGADAVMDLSTGGRIKDLRRLMLRESSLAFGTVPIYEAAVRAAEGKGSIARMTPDELFGVIEEHGQDGVDFITVHAGVTLKAVERLKAEGRLLDIVSGGGSLLVGWMI